MAHLVLLLNPRLFIASPGYFENRIPLKPALGLGGGMGDGVCSLANYSVANEEPILFFFFFFFF